MLYVRHWLTTHSHSHRLTFGEKQLDFRRKATGVLNRSKCPKRTIPICFQGFPLLTCDMLEITHQNSGFLVFSPNNAETVFISYLSRFRTSNLEWHCTRSKPETVFIVLWETSKERTQAAPITPWASTLSQSQSSNLRDF